MAPSNQVSANGTVAPSARPSSPSGGRRKPSQSSKPSQITITKSSAELYYGFREISKTACGFITSLFGCPLVPPPTTTNPANPAVPSTPELTIFIAYAIHRTRLPEAVVFTSLFLLARLKERFPAARGSSGHRLFISAFMIASKVVCDDTYSNKSWCIVAQNLYSLKEVNQMEREMCSYLEWILHVDHRELEVFTEVVRKMYTPETAANPAPWVGLRAVLPPSTSTTATESSPVTTSAPAIPTPTKPVISTSPAPATAVAAPPQLTITTNIVPAKNAYPSPSSSSPPSPSHSDSASPASSVSCLTPPNGEDAVSISGATGAPTPNNGNTNQKVRSSQSIADPSFAFAGPTVW